MMTNLESLSFGRYLKKVRLESGISLQQVANETKIGIENLLFIEKEDHDKLPAEVFVKGFLRAYAKAVAADPDHVVDQYLKSRDVLQETARIEADLIRSSANFWPRLLISLCILVCIITLSVVAASLSYKDVSPTVDVQHETVAKKSAVVDTSLPKTTVPPKDAAKVKVPDKLLLKVDTIEKTWLKVIIDGRIVKEYSLNPGDHLELEALSGFDLLIGNAAGVRLHLNERVFDIPGKRGQVVTIKVP